MASMENMYVFASPTEYGQYLAQSSKSEFERLTHTDKYDTYFINLGITKSSIQGGTQEENRMIRQRFMHALVGQLWMEGRIKIGRYQCMQDAKY
ncbi:uncharacterized protein LAJ45_02126 [Morchella importuna]|uniref:uncharacterized protein n=1 Tax=Morchella importuna TaxID=1174673 RepID=UPI001E8CF83D|nr:uncharacterized protein LAJ45_02126 [Morchella importuna]KAH8154358.1 hypothetical protein LAJ45_02126 [Morchella importuna]